MRFVTKYTKYTVYCGLIIKYAVCCKFITKCTVCCNLLANAANLLRNAQFVQIAKDHIRLPRSYGSPQTAANRRKPPQTAANRRKPPQTAANRRKPAPKKKS